MIMDRSNRNLSKVFRISDRISKNVDFLEIHKCPVTFGSPTTADFQLLTERCFFQTVSLREFTQLTTKRQH